jgi:hypothetical protein
LILKTRAAYILDLFQNRRRGPGTDGGAGVWGGLKVSCNAFTASLDAPPRNLQIIQDRHAGKPAKKIRDTLPHPLVASVVLPWLETIHFVKYMYMQAVLCTVIQRIV